MALPRSSDLSGRCWDACARMIRAAPARATMLDRGQRARSRSGWAPAQRTALRRRRVALVWADRGPQ
eukprot:5212507-Pyramimonas_sp.AAC.1